MNATAIELSVVLPCHNERANLRPLLEDIRAAVEPLGKPWEIIVTDDCSDDGSWETLRELAAQMPQLRAQRLAARGGQSVALWAGIRAARGRVIVTLDADRQNDPADIPKLLDALRDADCVCGSRVAARRQGDSWVRVLSSRIANRVRNALSGETISDAGCCFRAFRRECVAEVKFFRGAHRFLPTLIRMEGFRVVEVPIRHHPRTAGRTHYGIGNRLFRAFADLLAVRWMKKRFFRYSIAERIGDGCL
ncbi:MAG: glycosyltransferase family 2 protein [Verrucomicrobiae bacterium]|nr:glycosyltransferase family 2 protein [Verrucomicrobiae bacterium]